MSHSQPVVILTQKDQGKVITIPISQLFSIQLIENPTTGYRWTTCNISGVHLLAEKFQPNSISEGAIGHGGIRIFQFQAIHAGKHRLQFKHWREWQGDSSIIGTFQLFVYII
ncbi:protease inhibitor I42 family protein [Bacillus toyonensis]|uniref:protease inhibitor I42 family protein n=1 Tax=Bacillus toyonensis TaxID=155322 RepID=UPI000BFD1785|nr:peptidase inhibitor I42 [Bacillus toyonensis]